MHQASTLRPYTNFLNTLTFHLWNSHDDVIIWKCFPRWILVFEELSMTTRHRFYYQCCLSSYRKRHCQCFNDSAKLRGNVIENKHFNTNWLNFRIRFLWYWVWIKIQILYTCLWKLYTEAYNKLNTNPTNPLRSTCSPQKVIMQKSCLAVCNFKV